MNIKFEIQVMKTHDGTPQCDSPDGWAFLPENTRGKLCVTFNFFSEMLFTQRQVLKRFKFQHAEFKLYSSRTQRLGYLYCKKMDPISFFPFDFDSTLCEQTGSFLRIKVV